MFRRDRTPAEGTEYMFIVTFIPELCVCEEGATRACLCVSKCTVNIKAAMYRMFICLCVYVHTYPVYHLPPRQPNTHILLFEHNKGFGMTEGETGMIEK